MNNNLFLENIDNPAALERFYRQNKSEFKKAFDEVYAETQDNPISVAWQSRLHYDELPIFWGSGSDFLFILLACCLAFFVFKIPNFSPLVSDEFFYPRN